MANCSDEIEIRDVWAHNLESEVDLISQGLKNYPYIAIDTEFPGTVEPGPVPRRYHSTTYSSLMTNINLTKLIQLGITIGDDKGNLPKVEGSKKSCIWQFNFQDFDINTDRFVPASIELLRNSGIDFERFRKEGVPLKVFAETIMMSGVFSNVFVRLINFHGSSDFGYLIKCLRWEDLPEKYDVFMELVKVFFPDFIDVSHLATKCPVYGGLETLASLIGLKRVGPAHQAGSDSLLTYRVCMRLKESYCSNDVFLSSLNVIYGLESLDN
ncbi:probable CCR4-associated factor 1 homolog 2 [Impatiens glandulifera]|uniref:probable CCR4-associated factor 1 homolog 2 n=1 Tax=Impatiens glandulifera TaxID=253017 RepID=UPI001FB0E8E0|nr:probable CCR4-associated factor 1 homolog 2 [Impatiens glandulifera]